MTAGGLNADDDAATWLTNLPGWSFGVIYLLEPVFHDFSLYEY